MTRLKNLAYIITTALLALATTSAQAQYIQNGSGTIAGSLCVGAHCVENETFGNDTLRLKGTILRLHFDDRSVDPNFSSNDWRVVANSSLSGGSGFFSVQDATAGTVPFQINAGAPNRALHIDENGRIGLGTENSVRDIHILSGDTPGIRFQQDGSGGFSPHTWDIGANDNAFFVYDVSGSGGTPFIIKPDAPTSSLYVDAGGNVGIGSAAPNAGLHVSRSAGAPAGLLRLTNDDVVYMTLEDTSPGGETWNIQSHDGEFRFTNATGPGIELRMSVGGNLRIAGQLTTAGSCSVGCDAVFTDEYEIMPIAERAELMWAKGYLPNVGPTPEDGPFNITDKMGRMLNELEHAHIYIAQLNAKIDTNAAAHSAELAAQAALFQAQEERIRQLEQLIAK